MFPGPAWPGPPHGALSPPLLWRGRRIKTPGFFGVSGALSCLRAFRGSRAIPLGPSWNLPHRCPWQSPGLGPLWPGLPGVQAGASGPRSPRARERSAALTALLLAANALSPRRVPVPALWQPPGLCPGHHHPRGVPLHADRQGQPPGHSRRPHRVQRLEQGLDTFLCGGEPGPGWEPPRGLGVKIQACTAP